MSKLIAVCGPPNSGKTAVSLKLAQEIYSLKKTTVLYFSPDISVPALALIFPNEKDSDLHSVGNALNKTDIIKEDVLRETVTMKNAENFGYLGFTAGENKYTYPRPTEDKIEQLFAAMDETAEYSIIDCTCVSDDLISTLAKRDCDHAVRIFGCDLKSTAYYASCVNEFVSVEGKQIKVLNPTESDVYLPVKETEKHFKGMDFILPYERTIKQQMITGTLAQGLGGCAFKAEIEKTAKAVI